MGNKKTILILIANFLPGYKGGGPIKSIKNLTDHLSNEFNFKIITSDRDLGDKQPYSHITTNQWNRINGIDIFYASRNFLHFHSLIKLINKTDFDILYLNSLFQPIFSIQPVMAKYLRLLKSSNIILAPRGELEKGCLKIKPFKKKLFINISRFLGIHNDITWHATSEFEAISIKNIFHEKAKKINIAMNLTPKLDKTIFNELDFNYKNQDILKICFISRITREKNLDYALNIINNVSVRTIFNIYGTNHEDSRYWHKCEALIKQINNKNYHQINYLGNVSPEKVNDILKQHDLFFFPTVGENFAHVIFESLAAGTPVLISDRTPWLNLKEKGIGWDISLDTPDCFIKVIENVFHIPNNEYLNIRKNALKFAYNYANDNKTINDSRQMFLNNYIELKK